MQRAATRRVDSLLALPRSAKKTLAVLADSSLCVLTVWLAICFRFESWISLSGYQWLAVILSVALAIPLLTAFGFYHTVIRYVGRQTITAALRALGIYTIIYSAVFTAYSFPLVPRTIGVLQPILLLVGLALVRLSASQLLGHQGTFLKSSHDLPGVLIYGAGNSGQQLAASLEAKHESNVIAFLDDNANLQGARIAGIPVHHPRDCDKLFERYQIRDVLLAMPNLSRPRRTEIIKHIGQHQVAIRTLPSIADLAQGRIEETDLRELSVDDLLGRDPVAPMLDLMAKTITGKVVVVTGAGGSIGGEICRQIISLSPKHLILLELNEYALYRIHDELRDQTKDSACEITPLLFNVLDTNFLDSVFSRYRPSTVFHTAAYKHVPLVESNPAAGLRNNVLGTLAVAQTARKMSVSDMVLISTDKAVRPTNVMGASKRLAELVLHALSSEPITKQHKTRFCIVRFGNVLGSSGSVVPRFNEQIKAGGPITLTHPEITRYFMTIPEAAQLVLQASGLNADQPRDGHVYLLDMGESVRIMDLALTMIQLSGLRLRDEKYPDGDIAIKITGLRPGEKLYEELLISDNAMATLHPKILCAEDALPDSPATLLQRIQNFCNDLGEEDEIKHELIQFDIGYTLESTA